MKKIIGLSIALIVLSGFTTEQASASPTKAEQAKKRPNIIYILTDDQRYDELGIMNPLLNTPHMDSIAADGVHFKNALH